MFQFSWNAAEKEISQAPEREIHLLIFQRCERSYPLWWLFCVVVKFGKMFVYLLSETSGKLVNRRRVVNKINR